jgi:hypothetical protein
LKELVQFIARSLVNDPMAVRVEEVDRGSKVFLKLHVSKDDMGRVIGRGGRVANAMRRLVNVAATREGKEADLDIVDPQ